MRVNRARLLLSANEHLFDNSFVYHKMGYASAMGWIMFLFILLLTFAALRLSKRYVHYGS